MKHLRLLAHSSKFTLEFTFLFERNLLNCLPAKESKVILFRKRASFFLFFFLVSFFFCGIAEVFVNHLMPAFFFTSIPVKRLELINEMDERNVCFLGATFPQFWWPSVFSYWSCTKYFDRKEQLMYSFTMSRFKKCGPHRVTICILFWSSYLFLAELMSSFFFSFLYLLRLFFLTRSRLSVL